MSMRRAAATKRSTIEKPPGYILGDSFKTKISSNSKEKRYEWIIHHKDGSTTNLKRVDINGVKGPLIILRRGKNYKAPGEKTTNTRVRAKTTSSTTAALPSLKALKKLTTLEVGTSMEDIRKEFRACDKDGNGMLSQAELFNVFVRAGASRQSAEKIARDYFSLADRDNNGYVDFTEMMQEYERMTFMKITLWLRKNINLIDANHDGRFSFDEIVAALSTQVGSVDARRLCRKLMNELDKNKDKMISIGEMSSWYYDMSAKAKSQREANAKARSEKWKKTKDFNSKLRSGTQLGESDHRITNASNVPAVEAARKRCMEEGKLLYVHIGRDTCGNCVAMKRLYPNISEMNKVSILSVNCDKERWFWKMYQPTGRTLPFIIIANPKTNAPLQKSAGFLPKSGIAKLVSSAINAAGSMSPKADAKKTTTEDSKDEVPREIIEASVNVHNKYRAYHGVPAMKWDAKCYKTAKAWADRLAREGKMYHGGHKGMGQNLAWCSGDLSIEAAIRMWYDELFKPGYNYDKPGFSPGTGHFTQVVWKSSTHVACAVAKGKRGTYVVAHYSPPGNYTGRFVANVPRHINNAETGGKLPKMPERLRVNLLYIYNMDNKPVKFPHPNHQVVTFNLTTANTLADLKKNLPRGFKYQCVKEGTVLEKDAAKLTDLGFKKNDSSSVHIVIIASGTSPTKVAGKRANGTSKNVAAITEYGFPKALAAASLAACNGDISKAIEWSLRRKVSDAEDWKVYHDPRKGKKYFFNVKTGQSSYGAPGTAKFRVEANLDAKGKDKTKSLKPYFGKTTSIVKAQSAARSLFARKKVFLRKYAISHCPEQFKKIDQYCLRAPKSVRSSVKALASYLKKGPGASKSQMIMCRAIFRWITNNIAYNTKAYFSGRYGDNSAAGVLKSGLGVCAGYANLFKGLADQVELKSEVVSGYSKGYSFKMGESFEGKRTDHAWTYVEVDGKPGLIDSCWSAGHLSGSSFQKSFNEHYFLPEPVKMIVDHYPEKDKYQLLDKKMSIKEFSEAAVVKPGLWNAGLVLVYPTKAAVECKGEETFKFEGASKAEVTCHLTHIGKTVKKRMPGTTHTSCDGDFFNIIIHFPKKGDYEFELFAKPVGQPGSYPMALTVLCKANAANTQKFPKGYTLKPGERLVGPLNAGLKAKSSARFEFVSPTADKMAVSYAGKWTYLKRNGHVFSADVSLVSGKSGVKLMASYPGGNQFWTRYEWNVV